jgi:tripartite-type tricarboxylate transporter receptor subunit TctC
VSLKAPVKSVEDARKTPITVGVTTVGSDGDVYPALMNNTIGTKFKLVRGYPGSAAIDLAIERGEVEAQSDSFSSMAKHYSDWRTKIRAIVQFTLTRHPEMPDVPLIFDYLKPQFLTPGMAVEEAETFWRIMLIQKAMGRPFAIGPKVPPERVKALRDAFKAVLRDAEFQEEARRGKQELLAVDGAEVQAMLEKISLAPRAVIDRLNDALTYRATP